MKEKLVSFFAISGIASWVSVIVVLLIRISLVLKGCISIQQAFPFFLIALFTYNSFGQTCDCDTTDINYIWNNCHDTRNSTDYHYISTQGHENWTLDGNPIPPDTWLIAVYTDNFGDKRPSYGIPVNGSFSAILPGLNTATFPNKNGFDIGEPLDFWLMVGDCIKDSVNVSYHCTNPNGNGWLLDCDGLFTSWTGVTCPACGVNGVTMIATLEAFTTFTESCSDGIMNQNETGIDCGGVCPSCPCGLLTTTSGGRSNTGIMFSVAGINNATIDDLDITLLESTGTMVAVNIYYKSGSHIGFENNPGAWTLAGTANVTSVGFNELVNIPINLGLSINPGDSYGIYVTSSTGTLHSTAGRYNYQDGIIAITFGSNVYSFGAVYSPRVFNGRVNYTSGSCGTLREIDTLSCEEQDITIDQHWNIISSYIVPEIALMDSVFSDIQSDIILVKNRFGQAYIPSFGTNTIGNWDVTQGYQVKAWNNTLLTVCGSKADASINLSAGWSIISYLKEVPESAESVLQSISDDVNILKDVDGNSYIPSLEINTIGDMVPGQGYKVYLSNPTTLHY